MTLPGRRFRAATLTLAMLPAACSGCSDGRRDAEDSARSPDAPRGELLVSAAASLTDAFAEIEAAFEAAHPGVDVVLNLAGSTALRAQILEGAPIDVFASANRANMAQVADAGRIPDEARVFAHNLLAIAVPRGNPAGVWGLGDFAREDFRLGLCAEGVPCGDLARRVLTAAGVSPSLDTNEPDVRALLTKIELGELDAGVTYVTDVASTRGAVDQVDIPAEANIAADYVIAALSDAPNPDAAEAFVRFVLSSDGRAILARHGFVLP